MSDPEVLAHAPDLAEARATPLEISEQDLAEARADEKARALVSEARGYAQATTRRAEDLTHEPHGQHA